jgi:ParB-like chromosome segregation protein Spo0J
MSKKPKPESPSIEMLAPETLRAREVNPRVHPPAQLEALARSMREFGFTSPVLIDGEGVIIAGHGRVAAAIHAKLGPVPCIRVRHLTQEQVRAYVIADNRLATLAEWDEDMLRAELKGLASLEFDLSAAGFSGEQLQSLIGDIDNDKGVTIPTAFEVVAECNGEKQQQEVYQIMVEKGIKCRLVTL